MKPVFAQAKTAPKRVIYAEGEDERILRATQVVVEEGLARPILIGRPAVIEARLERFGLSIRPGRDFDADQSGRRSALPRLRAGLCRGGRPHGITPDAARTIVRTNATVIAALAVRLGQADAMICGVEGRYMAPSHAHPRRHRARARESRTSPRCRCVITAKGAYFLADTQVNAGSERGRDRRRWRCRRPPMCAASASSRRSRCSRTPISAATRAPSAPQDARARSS